MPSLTSPWFQQRVGPPAPPVMVPERSPSTMTEAEQDELTRRVGRPTTSSRAKVSQTWKLENTFMENGRHSWAKMELFEDCKKCMWTEGGTRKPSCKIRPLNKQTPRISETQVYYIRSTFNRVLLSYIAQRRIRKSCKVRRISSSNERLPNNENTYQYYIVSLL